MKNNQSYIWYVGYGSNLNKQRFLCYIGGGRPKYGKICNKGCSNKNFPTGDQSIRIPYSIYFALPNGQKETRNWGTGGVAFINPSKEDDENNWSLCRMWKITKEQYQEVRDQEGLGLYNKEILLGEENSIPIYTITNEVNLSNILPPSETYLKSIALGLKEAYNIPNEEIADYFMKKDGIKGKFTKGKLMKICEFVTLS